MKLSIITINYNNAEGLHKTLASVASQTFRDFEHIIVDGGSTDGSVEIIREYTSANGAQGGGCQTGQKSQTGRTKECPQIRWISEKDNGIYNAMNKGIKMANGEYLLFLNSGDYLVDPDTLKNVFEEAKDVDIIYGDRINVYEDGSQKEVNYFPDKITGSFMYQSMISHQASFIKSDLFVKYGLYREDLKYASDWEFFLKTFLLHNCSYLHLHQYVVYFDCAGISSVAANNEEMWRERRRVFAETLPAFADDYALMEKYMQLLRGYDKRANQLGKIILKPIRKIVTVLKKKVVILIFS